MTEGMTEDNMGIESEDQLGPPGQAYREIIREQQTEIKGLKEIIAEFIELGYVLDDGLIQRAREAIDR